MTVVTRPWASVVIPIKDEHDNLIPLTEQLMQVLDGREESRSAPFELLFIDDGSTDGSSDLLDRLANQYAPVKVFHFDRNYGQSAAFDAGFKQSTGELVMTIDEISRTIRQISPRCSPTFTRTISCAAGGRIGMTA